MTKLALVTGGTRGIGAEVSKALQANGYDVIANYFRSVEKAQKFNADFGIPIACFDVADYDECAAAVAQIEAEQGPIDILVNNAGIIRDAVLHRMPPEAWREVIETNLTSAFNMCRAVVPGMRKRGFGRIVNISSVNAQAGQIGQTNYAAAKAGLLGFTKALALESASKGITVNAICPGYVETDMVQAIPQNIREAICQRIPVGRFGNPAEIAHAVLFLVDENAQFCTGATLAINGGQHMS